MEVKTATEMGSLSQKLSIPSVAERWAWQQTSSSAICASDVSPINAI